VATLTVLKFETADGADQAFRLMESLQKKKLIKVLDAAVVTWRIGAKKPKLIQSRSGTATGGLGGAFWGMLFGLLFFVPFFGLAIGAAMGAVAGHFAQYGIDEEFINSVRSKVTEGTSAVFLYTPIPLNEKVLDEVKSLPKFEIIASNLNREQEAKLIEVFNQ
jgi:uncharacterized membrane protein